MSYLIEYKHVCQCRGSITRPEDIGGAAEIESDKLVESVREKGAKSDGEEDTKEDKEESPKVVMRKKKSAAAAAAALPPGWEKHEDSEGAYFWHVKSGTIQRERPASGTADEGASAASEVVRNVRSSRIFEDDFDVFDYAAATAPMTTAAKSSVLPKSCTSGSISDIGTKEKTTSSVVLRKIPETCSSGKGTNDWKRRSMPTPTEAILEESCNSTAASTSTGSSGSVHATMQVKIIIIFI